MAKIGRIGALVATLLFCTTMSAFAAPAKVGDSSLGKVLTDEAGMTLYTFDKDSEGSSACYDKCAANWPPLAAEDGDDAEGNYTVVKRKDGSLQWAYKGKPLYLWVKDTQPGDVTGEGVNKVWHVARP